jgi:hypothetical protein
VRRAIPLLALLAIAGCGNPGGDILAIEVREPTAGTPIQRLVVTDDGRGRCNAGDLERLRSSRLLEAREVQRELEELSGDRSEFRGPRGRRAYRAETPDATVTWVEGAPNVPDAIPKATLLALNLRRELCLDAVVPPP